MTNRRILIAAAPPAAAILVFGAIYGSLARPLIGAGATIASSLFIFSGAVQFTIAALLLAGSGATALIAGSLTLNLRNLLLGAVARPRIHRSALQRAMLAWFLTDEATGLALASDEDAGHTLLVSGATFYAAWQVGTVIGLLGASLEGVRDAATAVFPVLFVGLAALTCSSMSIAVRAVIAGAATAVVAAVMPDAGAIAAVGAAVAVAIPGRD
jgi:predicted branched-subunit amino acid permease